MCAGDGKERRGEDPHGVLESQEGADSKRGWTLNLRRRRAPPHTRRGGEGYKYKNGTVIGRMKELPYEGCYFFCTTGDEVICYDGRGSDVNSTPM